MTPTAATWRYTEALTVPALAVEMLDPSWRHADRPLVQFVMDWRRFPDQRSRVLAEEPPPTPITSSPPRWRRSSMPCASATGLQRLHGSIGTASTPASGCSVFRWIPPSVTRFASVRPGSAPSTAYGSVRTCSTPRPLPPERVDELNVDRLRELFAELDAELAGRSEPVRVLVAGGAALAFRWSDRTTYDVDLIGGDYPADFRRAIVAVAERHNLEWHWVNSDAKVGNAALERRPQPLYVGQNFQAYSPDARYLLAMKLFANRERDFDDAVRLSQETGITTAAEMLRLIDDAYYHSTIPAEIKDFAHTVETAVADRATQDRPQRQADPRHLGRGDDLGLSW